MATSPSLIRLPSLPVKYVDFISHVSKNPDKPMHEVIEPFKDYDAKMREIYAQQPHHPAVSDHHAVPVFQGLEGHVTIRARDLSIEREKERQCYIMPLDESSRKPTGSPAIVQSLKEFRTNFNIFSESALVDLDWSNVVVAGSAALTPLLTVPAEHAGSKRALRQYFHETIAPASDVDLFLYDLTEEQAIQKVMQIEQCVRDSILTETTTIRTKNAITIVSQYPTRHIQIVLRIYRSISEMLAGFDVDCACVAYDGKQVYASPRALAACITQTNTIDLSRRSPSYENRLSKYSHRGFEIHWPLLDRSRIDPTIFERSFQRVVGLARLLVMEKLPKSTDRDAYTDQRRAERGRPPLNRWAMKRSSLRDNIKDQHDDEVADWVDEEEVSNYHTFTIPYGPRYNARKIEKLLYKKDLLLNAEWNKPADRDVNLHRHPAFFGSAEDVVKDCCGFCPKPITAEEEEIVEQESKKFISGDISFLKDDPGRQVIGSFNPITDEDWTEMGYIGNTATLCNAIVSHDLETVEDWLSQDNADLNHRDHTGRTPLHLAIMCSTLDIVECLINSGARIVARLADGKTALHLAAQRGNAEMVSALLKKSDLNEEDEAQRVQRKSALGQHDHKFVETSSDDSDQHGSDISIIEGSDSIAGVDATTTADHSYVKVDAQPVDDSKGLKDMDEDEPDIYDVDVVAWDTPVSPLHLAIAMGHFDVVNVLVSEFGASLSLPVKIMNAFRSAQGAIVPLVLTLLLPLEQAKKMTRLLLDLGASTVQADLDQVSALHYFATSSPELLQILLEADQPAARRVLNHPALTGRVNKFQVASPLSSAIMQGHEPTIEVLLKAGATPQIDFSEFLSSAKVRFQGNPEQWQQHLWQNGNHKNIFETNVAQHVITAVEWELPSIAQRLVDSGADVNTLTPDARKAISENDRRYVEGKMLLDVVRDKIESLSKFNNEESRPGGYRFEDPTPLEDDSHYLKNYTPGTYSYWAVREQLILAKTNYKSGKERFERQAGTDMNYQRRLLLQKAAVTDLIEKFQHLETEFLRRGAKTFKEMYPDSVDSQASHTSSSSPSLKPTKPATWKPHVGFRDPESVDDREQALRQLFQACWTGDVETIKSYTLAAWSIDGEHFPPLKITTLDKAGFSTFHICVLRGHHEAVRLVLEISRIQYAPAGKTGKTRYTLNGSGCDDDGSLNEDGDIEIHAEIVDDQFTIDNIGEIHFQVKSQTTPLSFLQFSCPLSTQSETGALDLLSRMLADTACESSDLPELSLSRGPNNLFQLAIYRNDLKLLSFLIDLAEDQAARKLPGSDERDKANFFEFARADFVYALRFGQPDLLSEITRRTGADIPLNALIKISGVEVKEPPKFYQGLSVHGKKRADWAEAERGGPIQNLGDSHSPVLYAARGGNMSAVKWFQSEAVKCYVAFAEANQSDKRLRILAESSDGVYASIERWLGHNNHLLLHCVVMGQTSPSSLELLKYLVETQPGLLQARTLDGQTPLHLAFSLHRHQMAKILLKAGADPRTRDDKGGNIFHATLVNKNEYPHIEICRVKKMLVLLPSQLLPALCAERTSDDPGSATSLHRWLYSLEKYNRHSPKKDQQAADIVALLLKHMGEEADGISVVLDHIHGDGDTLLHSAVRYKLPALTRSLLSYRPELLTRENATGKTPYEVAQDAWLSHVLEKPPMIPRLLDKGFNNGQRQYWTSQKPELTMKILQKDAKSFVEEEPNDEESRRSDVEKVWLVCREFAQESEGDSLVETGGKRKLVSLLDANEVAKRLASRKNSKANSSSGRRRFRRGVQDEETTEKTTDEVQEWYQSALNADLPLHEGNSRCDDCVKVHQRVDAGFGFKYHDW